MKLRAPAYPLITVDPYFSVWSTDASITSVNTTHWTGFPNPIVGIANVDGEEYCFLGYMHDKKKLTTVAVDVDALSTSYILENDKIRLRLRFTTPLLLDDLDILTRPVSYLTIGCEKLSESVGSVKLNLSVSTKLCLDDLLREPVTAEKTASSALPLWRLGATEQRVLSRDGDDVRISWGHLYFGIVGGELGEYASIKHIGSVASASKEIADGEEVTVIFAYDDVRSIN